MALADSLLPEFDHEMAVTRRVLERVPVDRISWRPHPRSMTLGELAAHLSEIPRWATTLLRAPGYDMTRPSPAPAVIHESSEALLGAFDTHVAGARTLLAATSDAGMLEPWILSVDADVVFSEPRVGAFRRFLSSHAIHHRGQLSVYLRLCGIAVPSMYGPSADER